MQLELLRPSRATSRDFRNVPKHGGGAATKATVRAPRSKPTFLEFFAGSGLVAQGLRPFFKPVWANDICAKKAAVYRANHAKSPFFLGSIENVRGAELPPAPLAWASFPCQDLSLAGLSAGIYGERSGLVWQWLRVIDQMPARPAVLVAENVIGLVSSAGGAHYRTLHTALVERGYRVGALMLDAARWLPQSRPRIFVVAVQKDLPLPKRLIDTRPNWAHTPAVVSAMQDQLDAVWWRLPEPETQTPSLESVVEWDAVSDAPHIAERRLALVPERHRMLLNAAGRIVAPGYRRTRPTGQMLELRFDGIAGCLRTPEGGSSRQVLVLKDGSRLRTRLLTVREAARLMGAPDTYNLPGSYNDGYKAMGDAVAVPVATYLARHLLRNLVRAAS
jgi:DNA (cytosine-5)-methyltransferase 1